MKTILSAIVAVALSLFSAETPDQLRDKGFEALKAAQADETKIVDAARFLAQAAEAYEKAGNDDAASELGSYLYWCKKRMTLEQAETFAKAGDSGKRIAAKLDLVATRKVEPSDAGKLLGQAEAFAKAHPNDPLLCAIRFFEVADRFMGSQESLIAQRKSLDLMGKVKKVQVSNFSPVGEWDFVRLSDGKTYRRIFRADHTFVTLNYPIPDMSSGTWELTDGALIMHHASKETQSFEISDRFTMFRTGKSGTCTFRRVVVPDTGRK